jgi:hypothetical protein
MHDDKPSPLMVRLNIRREMPLRARAREGENRCRSPWNAIASERHLPAECRERETWRYVANQLTEAARGGDIHEAVIALRWSCGLSGCRACRREASGPPSELDQDRLFKVTKTD